METIKLIRQALRGEETDYTHGSINRAIILLAIPMILEMAMESLFAVVDAYFVAQVSTEAVATVGLTESVLVLVYAFAIGMSMATTAMVARRVGERDITAASNAAAQALYIGLALSLIIALLGGFFASDILILMGAEAEVVAAGTDYTRIMFGGNATIMFIFLINAIFRGAGDASLAMRSLILANGINIFLDPCLIHGYWIFPEMGVTGAAVATNIGRGVGVTYQIYHLLKPGHVIRLLPENLKFRFDVMKELIKISLGGIGQFLISTLSWTLLVRIVSKFGSEAVAGYTIAIRVIIFTILPSWGLANAAATLVGQNLGAGQPDRAEISVWRSAFYNFVFLAIISVIFIVFAKPVISFFTDNPSVIEAGANCLFYLSLGYVFYAYGMVMIQAFNGAGDTYTPTVLNLIFFWMIQIPLAYVLSIEILNSPTGAYVAIPVAETLLAITMVIIFRRGRWKTTQV